MGTITLSVPEELKERLDKHPGINWSEVFKRASEKKIKELEDFEIFNKIVSKSKLTEKDALELAREVNKGMHKKFKKLYPELL